MKSFFTLFGAVALLLTPAAANAEMYGETHSKDDTHTSAQVGQAAPDFEATTIAGEPFKLSDHKGGIVVLEWTNHECPYVIKHYDTGNMQGAQKTAMEKGVKWVSIVSSAPGKQGHVDNAKAAEIVEEQNAHITAKIIDESGEIGHLYGAKTTPHMYVIDAEGTLAYAGAIDDNSSPRHDTVEGATNYVLAAIDDLTAGQAVQVASSAPYGCSVKY